MRYGKETKQQRYSIASTPQVRTRLSFDDVAIGHPGSHLTTQAALRPRFRPCPKNGVSDHQRGQIPVLVRHFDFTEWTQFREKVQCNPVGLAKLYEAHRDSCAKRGTAKPLHSLPTTIQPCPSVTALDKDSKSGLKEDNWAGAVLRNEDNSTGILIP